MLLSPAQAGTWQARGLVFSDELGGDKLGSDELGKFRLVSVTGTGSILGPVVIVEKFDGIGPAVLVIRPQRSGSAGGNGIGASAFMQIATVTVVINRSPWPWAGFGLEMRELLDTPNSYTDGLSFDQMRAFRRPPRSDSFAIQGQVSEPRDRILFHGGVSVGASARFNFFFTDPSAIPEFYLIQKPRIPVS